MNWQKLERIEQRVRSGELATMADGMTAAEAEEWERSKTSEQIRLERKADDARSLDEDWG